MNGRASGLVLQSVFLVVLAHSAVWTSSCITQRSFIHFTNQSMQMVERSVELPATTKTLTLTWELKSVDFKVSRITKLYRRVALQTCRALGHELFHSFVRSHRSFIRSRRTALCAPRSAELFCSHRSLTRSRAQGKKVFCPMSRHCGPELPRIQTELLGHLLVRSLAPLICSLAPHYLLRSHAPLRSLPR